MNLWNWIIETDFNLCKGKNEIKAINLQPLTHLSLVFLKDLKICSINISGIRGIILELLAFLDAYQPHVVPI